MALVQDINARENRKFREDPTDNTKTVVKVIAVNTSGKDLIDEYETNMIDDFSATDIVYICMEKSDGTWLFKKIDQTGSGVPFTWASELNNPTVTDYDSAYSARLTLTYGKYSEAT